MNSSYLPSKWHYITLRQTVSTCSLVINCNCQCLQYAHLPIQSDSLKYEFDIHRSETACLTLPYRVLLQQLTDNRLINKYLKIHLHITQKPSTVPYSQFNILLTFRATLIPNSCICLDLWRRFLPLVLKQKLCTHFLFLNVPKSYKSHPHSFNCPAYTSWWAGIAQSV
jgi:hypothetical protein